MTDDAFDTALIGAAFTMAADRGWPAVTVAGAARQAGLDLAEARRRFPGRRALLMRFGTLADRAALAEPVADGATPQEILFDLLMRRIDALQAHRAGVLALFRALPADPLTALALAAATVVSMGWMLEAARIGGGGIGAGVRAQGLTAVWLWTIRSWQADESADLTTTMATLDAALARAAQMVRGMPGMVDDAAGQASDAASMPGAALSPMPIGPAGPPPG